MILTKPKKELWGGVIEFGELEPGTYIAEAEAWNTAENLLEGSGSAEIKVKAGETTDCTIKMILEGVFYSKYMLFSDSDDNMYAYDYLTCTEKKTWSTNSNSSQYSYFAEGNNGSIYYTKLDQSTSNYKIYNYNFTTNNEGIKFTIQDFLTVAMTAQQIFIGLFVIQTVVIYIYTKKMQKALLKKNITQELPRIVLEIAQLEVKIFIIHLIIQLNMRHSTTRVEQPK